MPEQYGIRHRSSRPRELGPGINPRSFSRVARLRFDRDRRQRYVSRIPDEPSNWQASLIDSMIRLEWSSLVAEAEGGLVGLREAREHRRLFQRLLGDFERTLQPKPGRPAARRSLQEILAEAGE